MDFRTSPHNFLSIDFRATSVVRILAKCIALAGILVSMENSANETGNAAVTSASEAGGPAAGKVYRGNPTTYLSILRQLAPGDTLILAPGYYDKQTDVPGLPVFNKHGSKDRLVTIMGDKSQSRPVFVGRSSHNTIRFRDASYIVIKHVEIDGRNLGGDGVNAEGTSHHITLEDLYIHGVGGDQHVVGISTSRATTWNWVIRRCQIVGAGTGMYLGNSDGSSPFIAGVVENNLFRDTIGYNVQIKHQNPRPTITGMPAGKNSTVIRHNVFSKSANSSTGADARPNLLVGHFPLTGEGVDDVYEIYGNFFYQNPTEALFQGEGNFAFHHNLLVNDHGDAVLVQPHRELPKAVTIFQNTIVAKGIGIRVSGGSDAFLQIVESNAVFADTPIQATLKSDNVTDVRAHASRYLNNPTAPLDNLDLYPRKGALAGGVNDGLRRKDYRDWDRDFNGTLDHGSIRGAYAAQGVNTGWPPRLEIKPPVAR